MIKVNISTDAMNREPIPAALHGLNEETLKNLQSELNPVPNEFLDIEFWPEVATEPNLEKNEKLGSEILTLDKPNKRVLVSYNVEQKTQQEIEAEIEVSKSKIQSQIQERLDSFAQGKLYNSCLSCCSYKDDSNPEFASEAAHMISLRSSTWSTAKTIYADVIAGLRDIPDDITEIEAELPALEWL